jgi:hypothetical protein
MNGLRLVSKLIAHLHQTKRRPKAQVVCFPILAVELIEGSRKKVKVL